MAKGEKLAPTVSPKIYRATATEENGEVLVRIAWPSPRLAVKDRIGTTLVYCWENVKPLILGKEVQAYSQSGKPMGKRAVLKALAKPVSVACFVRTKPDDPEQPNPVYTAVFRDDTVLLVFKAKDTLR